MPLIEVVQKAMAEGIRYSVSASGEISRTLPEGMVRPPKWLVDARAQDEEGFDFSVAFALAIENAARRRRSGTAESSLHAGSQTPEANPNSETGPEETRRPVSQLEMWSPSSDGSPGQRAGSRSGNTPTSRSSKSIDPQKTTTK